MKYNLKYLKENWEYKDDRKGAKWKVPEVDKDGKIRDDCDGWALAMLAIMCKHDYRKMIKELMFGKAKIVHAKSPRGVGHALLKWDNKYTDNWYEVHGKVWYTKQELKKWGYKLEEPKYRWYITLSKLHPKVFMAAVAVVAAGLIYAAQWMWG